MDPAFPSARRADTVRGVIQTWRWFGPEDPVDLERARQAGATGIVSSLALPIGAVWPREAVRARQALIERAGLRWLVVESLPVHPHIRLRTGDFERLIEHYITSLTHLAEAGLKTVCYNFMPVLDWTRTDLRRLREDGTRTLSFDADRFAAFDLYILERPGAQQEYGPTEIARARAVFETLRSSERRELEAAIIGGLPGANERGHTLQSLRAELARWHGVTAGELFENLISFLECVLPTCEALGVNLCIHPDDPPRPLLGLPRILGSADDCRKLFGRVPSLNNGLTLCSGSFAADARNKPHEIAEEFAPRVHFAHLRSVEVSDGGSFTEADHLAGDVDIVRLVQVLVREERRRAESGRGDAQIPLRPDHGAVLTGDIDSLPGYSWLGRLKGLAELRGVLHAVEALT